MIDIFFLNVISQTTAARENLPTHENWDTQCDFTNNYVTVSSSLAVIIDLFYLQINSRVDVGIPYGSQ